MAPGAFATSKRSFARAPDLAGSKAVALPLLPAPHCHTRPQGGRNRAGTSSKMYMRNARAIFSSSQKTAAANSDPGRKVIIYLPKKIKPTCSSIGVKVSADIFWLHLLSLSPCSATNFSRSQSWAPTNLKYHPLLTVVLCLGCSLLPQTLLPVRFKLGGLD